MSDPRFVELLDEYWNVAIKQGWERRSTDDELGSAQDAEHALHQYVNGLTAALAEANARLERYRLANTEENDLNIMAHEIDAAARALKEKP